MKRLIPIYRRPEANEEAHTILWLYIKCGTNTNTIVLKNQKITFKYMLKTSPVTEPELFLKCRK